jgi:hypothetical protein
MIRTEKTPSAERFLKKKEEITTLLTRLSKGIAMYGKGREDYFGKFDDLGYVRELITRASNFLFQEGECAK